MRDKRKFAILVVDDDPKIRELIQAYFSIRDDEATCVVASDVQEAALKLSNQQFDMILIDNILPIKLGIDYALSLKRSLKYSKITIILMSGAFQQEDVVKAVEGGIREVLVKPFTLKQFGEKIAPHITKYLSD